MRTNQLFGGILVLLLSNFAFTQTKIDVNFENRTLNLDCIESLRKGDWYYFEITDLNRMNYKVDLTVKDSIYSEPIDFSQFTAFNASGLVDLIGAVSLTAKKAFQAESISSFNSNFERLKLNSNQLAELEKKEDKEKNDEKGILANEYAQLEIHFTALLDLQKKLNGINNDFDIGFEQTKNVITSTQLSYTNTPISANELTKFNDLIINTKRIIFEAKNEIYSKQNELSVYVSKNATSLKKHNLDSTYLAIHNDYISMSTACATAYSNLNSSKVDSLKEILIGCINLSGHTYKSFPFQYNGEIASINFKFTPYATESKLPEVELPITINNSRKYIGIGPGFYYSSLKDEVYSTQAREITDSTVYSIVKEDATKGEVGLSVLLRGGTKFGDKQLLGAQISLGVGFGFTNPAKSRMMYGLGVTYGDRHRIALDLGGATGYSNILSKAYSTDGQYVEAPESVVVSKLKTGLFVSIGYLFTF